MKMTGSLLWAPLTRAVSTLLYLLAALVSHYETPLGWLIIPDVVPFAPIYEVPIIDREYAMEHITYNVGHLAQTTWIDEGWGRVVLAAHNPGAFSRLPEITRCTPITVISHTQIMTFYVVELLIVNDDNLAYLSPTTKLTLTLITCWGDQRLIVIGEPDAVTCQPD